MIITYLVHVFCIRAVTFLGVMWEGRAEGSCTTGKAIRSEWYHRALEKLRPPPLDHIGGCPSFPPGQVFVVLAQKENMRGLEVDETRVADMNRPAGSP